MNQPSWIDRPTPNLGKRKLKPTLIVLHHTGGHLAGDLATLTSKASRVSADFLIDIDGTIYKLNPQLTQYVTWHAGVSEYKGRKNCNSFSFGIELSHIPGNVWPDAQVKACAEVCRWLVSKFGPLDITSHREVARPVGRKSDPENFPWVRFSKHFHRVNQ
jgi:N-acetyl-anhydromuramyl-L-alanine amidase AmpD